MVVTPLRSVGARRVLVLVRRVEPLINLHQRLELRIVIPPVGSLVRRSAMRGCDPIQLSQVRIEDRSGVQIARVLFSRYRQLAIAPLRKESIAMTVGIRQAALRPEQRPEAPLRQEDVLGLLRAPPVVFRAAVLMIGN